MRTSRPIGQGQIAGMNGSRALLFSFSLVCCAAVGECLLARALVSVSTLPICWLTTCVLGRARATTSGGGRILAERDGPTATGDGDARAVSVSVMVSIVACGIVTAMLAGVRGRALLLLLLLQMLHLLQQGSDALGNSAFGYHCNGLTGVRTSEHRLLRFGLLCCSTLLALELSTAYLQAKHEVRADVRLQSLHEIGDRGVKWKAGRARGRGSGS